MKFIGIIPARFASTRFPGKPLALIGSKTMIQRVYEQALQSSKLTTVIVATDNQMIFDHVQAFGRAIYTSSHHPSGTDRCCEAANILAPSLALEASDVVINIQGDEPFVQAEQIDMLADLFDDPKVEIATLVKPITDADTLDNENVVKVVFGINGNALYFSRHPIPFLRGVDKNNWIEHNKYYSHLGMYAYRYSVLQNLAALPSGRLENSESLEQLRWLENGLSIRIAETHFQSPAVDTPEDLQKVSCLVKD